MARNIYCHKCGTYLGEIRDATLAKGVEYVCRQCAVPSTRTNVDMPDFMKDIFRG